MATTISCTPYSVSAMSPKLCQPQLQSSRASLASVSISNQIRTKTLETTVFRSPIRKRCFPVIRAVATSETTSSSPSSTSEAAARTLYIGNFPRTVTNDELRGMVEEHAAVEKVEVMYDKYSGRSRRFGFATMKTVEDANVVIEKLDGTEIGGRKIKVNITEKPLPGADLSLLQAEDSQYIDGPHKVYIGNLSKTVTTDILKNFFSEKGNVLSAKVSRVPGTSKSSGFGFVTFSSEEDVELAITSLNDAVLEGQKIRVNKAS